MRTKLLSILLLLTVNANTYLPEQQPQNIDILCTNSHPNPLFCLVWCNENDRFTKNSTFGPDYIIKSVPEKVQIDWHRLVSKTYFEVLEIVLPYYLSCINLKNKEMSFYKNGAFCDKCYLKDGKSILEIAVEHGNINMAKLLVKNGAKTQDAYNQAFENIKANREYIVNGDEGIPTQPQTFETDAGALVKNIQEVYDEGNEETKSKIIKLSQIMFLSDRKLLKNFCYDISLNQKMESSGIGSSNQYKPTLEKRINDLINAGWNESLKLKQKWENGTFDKYKSNNNGKKQTPFPRFMCGQKPSFFYSATGLHWMVLLASNKDFSRFIQNYKDLLRINAKDEYGKTPLDYALYINNNYKIQLLRKMGGIEGDKISN